MMHYFLQAVVDTGSVLDRLLDAGLSLAILAILAVGMFRYFSKRELEKDQQIQRLNDDKHKLAVDIVQTLGSFESILKASSPGPVKDAVLARLDEMHRDLRSAIDNIAQ